MTCACPTCAANRAIWDAATDRIASGVPVTFDPVTAFDEDTLRRSFGGLSKDARREQRRPVPLRVDEYGYDQHGRYHAAADGAA